MQSKLVFMASRVAAALIAAACGSSSSAGNYGGGATASPATRTSAAPVASSPSAQRTAVTSGTAIDVGSTRLGQVLVDSNGRTLYLFAADTSSQSTCNSAACVQYWPPLLTNDAPQAGTGVYVGLLGTTRRQDGTTAVTYAGDPPSLCLSRKQAGDVTG